MHFYGWALIIHVASASAFVMTMIIMQLVVANVMKRIPDSPEKKEAGLFIQKRWHPVVDAIIVMTGISAAYLSISSWSMLMSNSLLLFKAEVGMIALSAAYANHFYFRYRKRKLARSGDNPELLRKLGKVTAVLDKVALTGGVFTILLGWYFNHI